LVREGYEKVAPPILKQRIGKTPKVRVPGKSLRASRIDPFKSPRARAVLKKLRTICLRFPESSEARQFGSPAWLAGKRTFAIARHAADRLTLCFWVGVDQQGLLTADSRYQVPPYLGHNGWIGLNVGATCDWDEVEGLALLSYRHFALQRMLRQFGPD
jgi:hypothetical protein